MQAHAVKVLEFHPSTTETIHCAVLIHTIAQIWILSENALSKMVTQKNVAGVV